MVGADFVAAGLCEGDGVKIDFNHYKQVPAIKGRIATENDFLAGTAIYYQQGDVEPVTDMDLPSLAILTEEDGTKQKVVVVQMEIQIKPGQKNNIVCGLYREDGSAVVCLSDDLEFI